jgi:hypothetical protein
MKNFALCSDGRYSREKSVTDICDKMKLYVIIQMANFERLEERTKQIGILSEYLLSEM